MCVFNLRGRKSATQKFGTKENVGRVAPRTPITKMTRLTFTVKVSIAHSSTAPYMRH
jgi:hypothetical protein